MSDPLAVAAKAKRAYRDDPTDDNRAAHREASAELRYARWVQRGGPAMEAGLTAEYERIVEAYPDADVDPLRGHSSRVARELYARWLTENPEG